MELEKAHNAQKGDEGVNLQDQDMHAWQYAWARLISKAWADDSLCERITNSSESVTEELIKLGYTPPGKLKITVRQAPEECIFDPDKVDMANNKANGYFDCLDELTGELIMVLPPKPENPSDFAYALTDYTATGKDYPLSL